MKVYKHSEDGLEMVVSTTNNDADIESLKKGKRTSLPGITLKQQDKK